MTKLQRALREGAGQVHSKLNLSGAIGTIQSAISHKISALEIAGSNQTGAIDVDVSDTKASYRESLQNSIRRQVTLISERAQSTTSLAVLVESISAAEVAGGDVSDIRAFMPKMESMMDSKKKEEFVGALYYVVLSRQITDELNTLHTNLQWYSGVSEITVIQNIILRNRVEQDWIFFLVHAKMDSDGQNTVDIDSPTRLVESLFAAKRAGVDVSDIERRIHEIHRGS
jgi:archaellin